MAVVHAHCKFYIECAVSSVFWPDLLFCGLPCSSQFKICHMCSEKEGARR